jgi:hypothetical protein
MKYIISILLLSNIVYSVYSVYGTPVYFEPGPVFDEIYVTPNTPTNTPSITPTNTPSITPTNTPSITPTNTPSITPTNTPSITPTNTPNIYDNSNKNPSSSFVIKQNQYNQPNVLFPNTPLF